MDKKSYSIVVNHLTGILNTISSNTQLLYPWRLSFLRQYLSSCS